MSKSQRVKGATYEREIVIDIRDWLGIEVKRNLDQVRDGGADIMLGPFVLECKRRKKIAIYEWMEQAENACKGTQIPVVVCRADDKKSLAIMRWKDFLALLGNEL